MQQILLRRYRLISRKAYLTIDDGVLSVVLPRYLGRRPWPIPISNLAVVPPRKVGPVSMLAQPSAFEQDLAQAYLVTTSPLAPANLQLLFRTPQPAPRLRLLAVPSLDLTHGRRQPRSGMRLDSVRFRAVDADSAHAMLCAAGAETTDAPTRWMRQHRPLTDEPKRIDQLVKAKRRTGRLTGATLAGAVLCMAGLFVTASWTLPIEVAGAGLLVLSGVLGVLAARREHRSRPE